VEAISKKRGQEKRREKISKKRGEEKRREDEISKKRGEEKRREEISKKRGQEKRRGEEISKKRGQAKRRDTSRCVSGRDVPTSVTYSAAARRPAAARVARRVSDNTSGHYGFFKNHKYSQIFS